MVERLLVTTPLPIEVRAYSSLLENVEILYNLSYWATFPPEQPSRLRRFKLSGRRLPERDRLTITLVAAGSLMTELSGAAEALSKLRDLLRGVLRVARRVAHHREYGDKIRSEAAKNHAEAIKTRAEAFKTFVEGLDTYVGVLRKAGFTQEQITKMVPPAQRALEAIIEAAESGELIEIDPPGTTTDNKALS